MTEIHKKFMERVRLGDLDFVREVVKNPTAKIWLAQSIPDAVMSGNKEMLELILKTTGLDLTPYTASIAFNGHYDVDYVDFVLKHMPINSQNKQALYNQIYSNASPKILVHLAKIDIIPKDNRYYNKLMAENAREELINEMPSLYKDTIVRIARVAVENGWKDVLQEAIKFGAFNQAELTHLLNQASEPNKRLVPRETYTGIIELLIQSGADITPTVMNTARRSGLDEFLSQYKLMLKRRRDDIEVDDQYRRLKANILERPRKCENNTDFDDKPIEIDGENVIVFQFKHSGLLYCYTIVEIEGMADIGIEYSNMFLFRLPYEEVFVRMDTKGYEEMMRNRSGVYRLVPIGISYQNTEIYEIF